MTKQQAIEDLDLAIKALEKTKEEVDKITTNDITTAYCAQWSVAKIKRNCIFARGILLDIKKECDRAY